MVRLLGGPHDGLNIEINQLNDRVIVVVEGGVQKLYYPWNETASIFSGTGNNIKRLRVILTTKEKLGDIDFNRLEKDMHRKAKQMLKNKYGGSRAYLIDNRIHPADRHSGETDMRKIVGIFDYYVYDPL